MGGQGSRDGVQLAGEARVLVSGEQPVAAPTGDGEGSGETEPAGQECSGTETHPGFDFRGSGG